ncbi:MAG TPA: hypothetical protein VJB94_00675 [Candidatus Nanoarchaeia archaeon]|nr:hypothetical protein [Candidatus Nanoarchaeia archaeon]
MTRLKTEKITRISIYPFKYNWAIFENKELHAFYEAAWYYEENGKKRIFGRTGSVSSVEDLSEKINFTIFHTKRMTKEKLNIASFKIVHDSPDFYKYALSGIYCDEQQLNMEERKDLMSRLR